MDMYIQKDPLGADDAGKKVYLKDIWPTTEEVNDVIKRSVQSEMFRKEYSEVFQGDQTWNSIRVPTGDLYDWSDSSTYIKKPPYFEEMADPSTSVHDFSGLRVLALLGDSVTTDHISPAGNIAVDSPAGKYLVALGVKPSDFNSYGSRRGNHEVMVRGTLANIRLRNLLALGTEGGWTRHIPSGEKMFIYDAAMRYQSEGTPLLIIAGKEYGSGSSRDWAAKGTLLLGVKAVIADSFERIHRSNLVGMGVLPIQFLPNENRESLRLTGEETYHIEGVADAISHGKHATVRAFGVDGMETKFEAVVRIDTPQEAEYYRNGGILPYVLRQIAAPVEVAQVS
jgi:aconitate hydratase